MRISAREACVKPHLRTQSDIKFYFSLVNNSSAENFSRLQLGKTSSHVENFKSQFRHSTINYKFKLNKQTLKHFQRLYWLRLDVV